MKKERSHIIFSELVALGLILFLVSAAFAQPNSTNASSSSTILLEDFEVVPQFTQPQLQPLQWLTVIDVECGSCEEGKNATFMVKVTNMAARPFSLNAIVLTDADNIIFAGAELDSEIAPNETEGFELEAPLPPATRGRTLYYIPCFSVTDSAGGEPQQSCERAPRRLLLSGISIESMFASIYILLAIVLLAIAVAYFALSSKLGDSEPEEPAAEEQPSQTLAEQPAI
jgi:hypothetical protein